MKHHLHAAHLMHVKHYSSKENARNTQDLLVEAQAILERNANLPKPYPPLDGLIEEFHREEQSVQRKVFFYQWSGMFLLVAIPLISVLLSASIITNDIPAAVPVISLVLTVLTIVNAAFRPDQRFPYLCQIGIGIENLKMAFSAEVIKATSIDDLQKCVSHCHEELQKYSRQLIYLFLPNVVVDAGRGFKK